MLLVILGRQPKLSLAELEAKFGAQAVEPVGREAALIDTPALDIEHFGGLIRSAKLLTRLEKHDFHQSVEYVGETLPDHIGYFEGRKIPFGLSVYGFDASPGAIAKSALDIKKRLKNTDKTLRVIENKARELNAAQILRNQVVKKGLELLIIRDRSDVILAQTTAIQDIDAYGQRDYGRPKRDAKVGMLPPKLAQIMINLAVGSGHSDLTVLDPFCGTGVILQEALLMGYRVIGSDIEPKMIEYSRANLKWLSQNYAQVTEDRWKLESGDARQLMLSEPVGAIVSELYLGQPLSREPSLHQVTELKNEAMDLLSGTLSNFATQIAASTRLCLAVPAWRQQGGGLARLPLENLAALGYNRVSFKFAAADDLIYARADQIVARELLVLERI
jgi:tRNA G10  N-methylase Trm11